MASFYRACQLEMCTRGYVNATIKTFGFVWILVFETAVAKRLCKSSWFLKRCPNLLMYIAKKGFYPPN